MVMHYRSWAIIISSGVIGLSSLASAPRLHAQTRFPSEAAPLRLSAASLLGALSSYRTVRWASTAAVIHCSPAPLTERPGIQAEFARPHVVPLEEAFADAQSVKRAIEYRARAVALENR
jgi:hypothetical protein